MGADYDLAVLGAGYTGKALCSAALRKGLRLYAVSRRRAAGLEPGAGLPFLERDLLAEPEPDLPEAAVAVVSFPLPGAESAAKLMDGLARRCGRVLYVNTIGVYLESGGRAVDESSPVAPGNERVPGETLVLERGGTSLRAAGLYGPGRSPLRWIERGALKRTQTLINLVHRDDLAEVLLELAAPEALPPVLNCSDGRPLPRSRLFELYEQLYPQHPSRPPETTSDLGKAVCNDRLRSLLPGTFVFRDSLQAILSEERASDGPEAAR